MFTRANLTNKANPSIGGGGLSLLGFVNEPNEEGYTNSVLTSPVLNVVSTKTTMKIELNMSVSFASIAQGFGQTGTAVIRIDGVEVAGRRFVSPQDFATQWVLPISVLHIGTVALGAHTIDIKMYGVGSTTPFGYSTTLAVWEV